jgi:hypothetical protein
MSGKNAHRKRFLMAEKALNNNKNGEKGPGDLKPSPSEFFCPLRRDYPILRGTEVKESTEGLRCRADCALYDDETGFCALFGLLAEIANVGEVLQNIRTELKS